MKTEPNTFQLETTTVWQFPQRGDWATHDGTYRGNWSPYIPRNILLRFSHQGDIVLDPFVGGGTTLVEAKLLQRHCIGIDINPLALKRCHEKCNFKFDSISKIIIRQGDARSLPFLKDSSIDLICTHPPYANIIKYSQAMPGDLSLYDIPQFLNEIERTAAECYRLLKSNKYCAVLMGDTRKKGCVVPLGFQVMNRFIQQGFTIKEIVIKEQHNCKATGFWKTRSLQYNFLLLAHEDLFVFKKS